MLKMILNNLDIIKVNDKQLALLMDIFKDAPDNTFHKLEDGIYLFTGNWEPDFEVEVLYNLKEIWVDWRAEH